MGKKGVKIRELATELGVTSRQITERCRVEGFVVQNSISKLSPEVERKVRTWCANDTRDDTRSTSSRSQG